MRTEPEATPAPAPAFASVPVVSVRGLPEWLLPVAEAAGRVRGEQISRFLPPESGGRPSAVLILFGEGERGPELLLMERARALRAHAGQPSFPGGALDPQDSDPQDVPQDGDPRDGDRQDVPQDGDPRDGDRQDVPQDGDRRAAGPLRAALRAALREAQEETGLDPAGVQIFGVLPSLYIPVSDFVVIPVLGWWRMPSPVGPVDEAETARVFTVPIDDLADPANRTTVTHPSGYRGPAFLVADTQVWGFTAGLIDAILRFAGWERDWDRSKEVPLSAYT